MASYFKIESHRQDNFDVTCADKRTPTDSKCLHTATSYTQYTHWYFTYIQIAFNMSRWNTMVAGCMKNGGMRSIRDYVFVKKLGNVTFVGDKGI